MRLRCRAMETTLPFSSSRAHARRAVATLVTVVLVVALLTFGAGAAGAAEETGGDDGSGRRAVAETPRDQFGLVLFGALGAIALGGMVTANRQLKGRRPQADGEFRWR